MYDPFKLRQGIFSAQRQVQLLAKVGAGSLGADQLGVLPTSDAASKATQTATQEMHILLLDSKAYGNP